jgi:CHAD domain-containing protein
MEVFESLYGEEIKSLINLSKKLQDLLGSIHDADVWMDMIPSFIKEEEQRIITYFGHNRPLRRLLPGLRAFAANRERSRVEDYRAFCSCGIKPCKMAYGRNWTCLSTLP